MHRVGEVNALAQCGACRARSSGVRPTKVPVTFMHLMQSAQRTLRPDNGGRHAITHATSNTLADRWQGFWKAAPAPDAKHARTSLTAAASSLWGLTHGTRRILALLGVAMVRAAQQLTGPHPAYGQCTPMHVLRGNASVDARVKPLKGAARRRGKSTRACFLTLHTRAAGSGCICRPSGPTPHQGSAASACRRSAGWPCKRYRRRLAGSVPDGPARAACRVSGVHATCGSVHRSSAGACDRVIVADTLCGLGDCAGASAATHARRRCATAAGDAVVCAARQQVERACISPFCGLPCGRVYREL